MSKTFDSVPTIKFVNIGVSFQKTCVLKNINLDISEGIIQVLVGDSGIGKSSLLRCVNGLLVPNAGETFVFGVNTKDKASFKPIQQKIGYIPQNLGLVKSLSALENVLMGCLGRTSLFRSLLKLYSKNDILKAKELLTLLGLEKKFNQKVYPLSGGEKKRVAIARALMQNPRILLADEFLSDLDNANAEKIMQHVIQLKNELNLTVLMVEHNLQLAETYGDCIATLTPDGLTNQHCVA